MFHVRFLVADQRTRALFKGRQHPQRYSIFPGELHRPGLQDLGAQAGHLQHFFRGDPVQTPGLRDDARVGGIDPIDVGIDTAFVRTQGRRHGHRSRVRSAAPQGRNIVFLVDALKAGHHYHPAGREIAFDPGVVDVQDASTAVDVIGTDTHLAAGIGARITPELLQGHRE